MPPTDSTKRHLLAFSSMLIALAASAQERPAKEREELKRIRQQYQQRREVALKPIVTGCQQQSESLLKSLTQRNDLDGAIAVRYRLTYVHTRVVKDLFP